MDDLLMRKFKNRIKPKAKLKAKKKVVKRKTKKRLADNFLYSPQEVYPRRRRTQRNPSYYQLDEVDVIAVDGERITIF